MSSRTVSSRRGGSDVRRRIRLGVFVAAVAVLVVTVPGTGSADPAVSGADASTLQREPQVTPQDLGDGSASDLLYADPTEGLSQVVPPKGDNTGGAKLQYPLVLPKGRGMTPELSINYDSGGASSWVGNGWDLSVGDIGVDTQWGVPLFCPRDTGPKCDNVESESYLLDGEPLMPSAVRSGYLPRKANRQDFTRRVETEYERILRQGDSPANYFWRVQDKDGNIRWYGGYPDEGGPDAENWQKAGDDPPRTTGDFRNDGTRDANAIETDGVGTNGNAFRWYLSAQRDVGVNLFRYTYDTVTYQNVQLTNGTGWEAISGTECPSGHICAKHVYLKKILYTGAGQLSGHDESPAYEVVFNREATRPDPVLDGRGGFLDLDQERLTSIEVRFRETDQLVTRYDLHYTDGRFGKSQLDSITQVGCAGAATCDTSTSAKHSFTYYDDVAAAHSGFGAPAQWDTVREGLNKGHQVNRASALGMSETNGGDGSIYLGFNPFDPEKTGSFGGSITLNGGTTNSLVEFVDINGDSLPDKVFASGSSVKYHLNTSQPGADPTAKVTFEKDAGTVADLDNLPSETEFGVSGGIGAYFVAFGVFNVGGSWSFANSYFTDANGDGLVDFVTGGTVLFNHLNCSTGDLTDPNKCVPTFSSDDAQTRVPLDGQANAATDDSASQALQLLRDLAPPVDTVRRWTAPFAGTITIGGTATLLAPPTPGDTAGTQPVRVAVQRDGAELGSSTLVGVGATWTPAFGPKMVAKGAHIYFRTSSRSNGGGDDVKWDPTITYTNFSSPGLDANGLDQVAYKTSTDFTLAGRPGTVVTLPQQGTARFTAAFDKSATTDDVTPRVRLLPNDGSAAHLVAVDIIPIAADGSVDSNRVKSVAKNGSQWCVSDPSGGDFGCFDNEDDAKARLTRIGAAEDGRFRLSADVSVNAVTGNKADALQTWLSVDSPIDVQQISWLERPQICYPDAAGACDQQKPIVNQPVDIDVYPLNDQDAPVAPWTSTRGHVDKVNVKIDVAGGNAAGDIILTIKKNADGFVFKRSIPVDASDLAQPVDLDLEKSALDLTSGEKYWFDLSVRNPGLSGKLSNPSVTLKWTEKENGKDVEKTVRPPVTLNWVGQQGFFPVAYRGWALAGYRSDGDRATKDIIEGDFVPGPADGTQYKNKDDACKAQPNGCLQESDVDSMGYSKTYPVDANGMAKVDLSSATKQIPKAFAYIPTLDATLQASWQVVAPKQPRLMGTADTSRSARLGNVPVAGAAGSGSTTAPSLWGATGPEFSIMAGVGPISGSFGFGWSSSVIDYMDMNGDGFPDIVTPDKITFTNPRGGRSCIKDSATVDCSGSGVEVVQQSTSIGGGGGLGGAPIGFKNNSKGRTNATQGNSTNKGGDASDKEYGGDLGLSLGFTASFSNPNSADPQYDKKLDKVPGDPQSPGLATEQVLADMNADGLPDRVSADPSGVYVRFNLGYGFASKAIKWAPGGFESAESYSGSLGVEPGFSGPFYDFSGGISSAAGVDYSRYSWEDVNGDGIPDAMHKNDTTHTVDVAFGTGIGVGEAKPYGDMASLPFDIFPGIPTDLAGQQIRQDEAQSLGGGVDVTIGFGPLCIVACYLIVNPGGHFENSLGTSDIDLTDVNGDGAPDSVSREALPKDDVDGNHEQLNVRLNTVGKTGLLESVTTPMKGTITLDYARKGNTIAYPDSLWALTDVKVHASRGSDGVADQHSTYEYGTPRYAFVQREDLGFDKVVEHQLDEQGTTKRTIERDFLNNTVFDSGLETKSIVSDENGKKVQGTDTEWELLNLDSNQPLNLTGVSTDDLLQLRAAPQIAGTTETWFDSSGGTGRQSLTSYTYDRLGNPTLIDDKGDPTNPDDDVVAKIRYSDCTISASDDLNRLFGCADGFPAKDPDTDPTPIPPVPVPAAHAPYWSKDLCPTWTSTPATIEIDDASGKILRYRDGSRDECDNTSVTYLKELVKLVNSLDDPASTYAITQLAYDDWGSYNRIVYPPDNQGKSYAVFYTYDQKRQADVAQVTDLSLDEDQIDPFLTTIGALDSSVDGTQTTLTVNEDTDPPNLPFPIWVGGEKMQVTDRVATATADQYTYTVQRGTSTNAPYDAGSNVFLSASDPSVLGITSSATFDGPTGRVSSRTDANGNVTQYLYDALSRQKKITYPDGGTVDFEYAPTNSSYPYAVARHSDEFNADTIDTATFVDGMGDVTGRKKDATLFEGPNKTPVTGFSVEGASIVDALGRTTSQYYPTKQLTGSLTDYWDKTPSTLPTVTQWDALDRVVKETLPNQTFTTTAYGFASLDGKTMATTEVTDPKGRKTVRYSDAHDNTRAVDDIAAGLSTVRTRYAFDALGQLHTTQSSPKDLITNTYDLLGQRLSTTTPDGGKVEYAYDLAGNLVSKRTPNFPAEDTPAIAYGYEFGHLVSIDYPDGTPGVKYTWGGYSGAPSGDNGVGRITEVLDAARDQKLGYDQNGRLDNDQTTMQGKHPNRGPFTTSYDFDFLGRLANAVLPDGETVTNDYDHGGQLSNVSGAKACTSLGRLTSAIDAVQTVITVTENPLLAPPTLPFTIWIDKEQLQVTDRTATSVVNQYTYKVVRGINGTAILPTNVPHSAGAGIRSDATLTCNYGYLDRREYDEFGTRAFQSVGNGVSTRYTFEPATRRLSNLLTMSPAAPFKIQDLLYIYDEVGNLKSATDSLPADVPSLFGGPNLQTYIYDTRYRIKHAEGTWDYAPKTRRQYVYEATYDDASGNVTSATQRDWTIDTSCKNNCKQTVIPATTYDHSSIAYAPSTAHRYAVVGAQSPSSAITYTYDLDGNVTKMETATNIRTISWNAADEMTQIVDHNKNGGGDKITNYTYDYNGELAIENTEQGQSSFVNPWVTVRAGTMWKHIWAGDDRLATKFVEANVYEQKLYFLLADLAGSTNLVTDTTGKVFQHHEYFPTGQVWADESSTVFRTPYQFAGAYFDEDHGVANMGQRWYEPDVGSFNSVEPILTEDPMAIVDDPDLRGSYTYADNNALTNVDPDGRILKSVHVDPVDVRRLTTKLKADGTPLFTNAQQNKIDAFFKKHPGVIGKIALKVLGGVKEEDPHKKKSIGDLLESKPLLEFEFENGKLQQVKLGFGVGKRAKLLKEKPAAGTPTPAAPSQSGGGGGGAASTTSAPVNASTPKPAASSGAGNASAASSATASPPTSGGSTTSSPVKKTKTSAGGGNP